MLYFNIKNYDKYGQKILFILCIMLPIESSLACQSRRPTRLSVKPRRVSSQIKFNLGGSPIVATNQI